MTWIEIKSETHPLKNSKWVAVIAEIKYNLTGEIREYETKEILEDGEEIPSVFNWEENNYSCDCNRILFFKRAKGESTEHCWVNKCTDGKFSVNLKNKADGKAYYREFES